VSSEKRIIIIGGVAGGASAAARARRLSEDAEIVLFERGNDISFANCGMPYHIGGVIPDRDRLLVQTPRSFQLRFNVKVRTRCEVMRIERKNKQVVVKNLESGEETRERYDQLILSPGAEPARPPIPGIDAPGIFTLRSLADMDAIKGAVDQGQPHVAVVIGGGFIGLEMTEALRKLGLQVTLVEMASQVMVALDPEMATPLHEHLRLKGVDLRLGQSVTGFKSEGSGGLHVLLSSGDALTCQLAVLAIGVKPETRLAREAGLTLGERDGIRVDEFMRTSDPDIYAVGDAVETEDLVGGYAVLMPLAGPANRQGRIAADNIFGRSSVYRKSQGTAICKVFDLAAGTTGLNEKNLKRLGRAYEKVYVHPSSHAGYYPGAHSLSLKLLFAADTGKVLRAQVVGVDGVDKRLDVLAVAVRAGLTVYDLEALELAYAPPFGSAKDPVNYAGFVAANALRGDVNLCHVDDIVQRRKDQVILDVRSPLEVAAGTIPGAMNIPLDELRRRLSELSQEKEYLVTCQVGMRGYLACRILSQRGYRCRNLSGGYATYKAVTGAGYNPEQDLKEAHHDAGEKEASPKATSEPAAVTRTVDARGLQCPGPILQLGKAVQELKMGEAVKLISSDSGFATDVGAWCHSTGNQLLNLAARDGNYEAVVLKTGAAGRTTETRIQKKVTLIAFSNEFDRAMSTFIIANGAAAMGHAVTIFFTFWGLNILRRKNPGPMKKDFLERMFGWMMPRGADRLTLSKLNFGGLGTKMMQFVMRRKNVSSLQDLIGQARLAGVRLVACTMTMNIMGIKKEELIDGVEEGGVALYLDQAEVSALNLMI